MMLTHVSYPSDAPVPCPTMTADSLAAGKRGLAFAPLPVGMKKAPVRGLGWGTFPVLCSPKPLVGVIAS